MLTRKRLVIIAGVAVLLLVVAFLCGRFSRKNVETQVHEKVVYQDRVVEKVVEVKVASDAAVQKVVVYRDRWIKPDGTVHEHSEERADTATSHTEKDSSVTVKVEERVVEKVVERLRKETTPLPAWRVGVLAGVDLTPLPVGPPGLALGGLVEHRFIGPISLGVWGLGQPRAGGASVSLNF